MTLRAVDDLHPPGWKIDGLNFAVEEPDFLKHFADRVHDVRDIQIASGHLVQHGRKQEKVLAINKCDLEVRVTAHRLLQLERGVQPAEAPAQYQNPSWPVRIHQTSLRSAKTEKRPSRSSECLLEKTGTPNRPVATAAWTSFRRPSYDFLRGPWRTSCELFHYAEGIASPRRRESSWDRRPQACPSPSPLHNNRRIGVHTFEVPCRTPPCHRPTGSSKSLRRICCGTADLLSRPCHR